MPFTLSTCWHLQTDWIVAGNRWHIDCFRCNTCNTLLDSDANLLLLGDGSLICNNCTYSCSACGNKIEDLAILTGDQAFCATCFRCRNCKKKIENLKYARTSQGIFCMECHESLMQRRRKKTAKSGTHRHKHHVLPASTNSRLLDKSLPSLPPSANLAAALSPDNESLASDGYSDTPTELPRISKRPVNSRSSSQTGTPTEPIRASQRRPPHSRSSSSRSSHRDKSPAGPEEDRRGKASIRSQNPRGKLIHSAENLTLPSSTFKKNRHSALAQPSDMSMNGEEFFIPMALDPNPVPGPSPLSVTQVFELAGDEYIKPASEGKTTSHDYFTARDSNPTSRVTSQIYEQPQISMTSHSPRESRHSSQASSPHIAYQAGNRDGSSDRVEATRRRKGRTAKSSSNPDISRESPGETPVDLGPSRSGDDEESDQFMLQEVPKSKKSNGPARSSKLGGFSQMIDTSCGIEKSSSAPASANTQIKDQNVVLPAGELPVSDGHGHGHDLPLIGSWVGKHEANDRDQLVRIDSSSKQSSQPSSSSAHPDTIPHRSDSLAKSGAKKHIIRREVGTGHVGHLLTTPPTKEIEAGKTAFAPPLAPDGQPVQAATKVNGTAGVSTTPIEIPSSGSAPGNPPPRSRDRARLSPPGGILSDAFMAPRPPPSILPGSQKAKHESTSTQRSESSRNGDQPASPKLPRYSAGGDFSMEDDMARILGNEEQQDHASFLRRVSNSVRHARSYSDRGTRLSREQKWPRSPLAGSPSTASAHENGSPASSSPELREELSWLKNELLRERQKTTAKEQRLSELEAALEARNNIRQMNNELREKRSTMVVLDTQKEIVVRELEVLTEHIAAAKKSGEPLDVGRMSNMVLREFAEALQALKDSFTPKIEDLTQTRNDLIEEVSSLNQLRDKTFQEFEQLSSKNAQLAELNNQLVHQIQELRKLHPNPSVETVQAPPNGLGIYTPHAKEKYSSSLDGRDLRTPSIADSNLTGSTVMPDHDGDPAAYLTTPQLVKIRKAQPKKFNWKRSGHTVAKGVTKGLKGAFSSSDPHKVSRDGPYLEGPPDGSMPPSQEPLNGYTTRGQMHDPSRQGFGFFGNPKAKAVPLRVMPSGGIPPASADGIPGMYWIGSSQPF